MSDSIRVFVNGVEVERWVRKPRGGIIEILILAPKGIRPSWWLRPWYWLWRKGADE